MNAVDAYLGSLRAQLPEPPASPLSAQRGRPPAGHERLAGLATNRRRSSRSKSPSLGGDGGATPSVNLTIRTWGATSCSGGRLRIGALRMLAAHSPLPGAQVFAFDVGYSMWALAGCSAASRPRRQPRRCAAVPAARRMMTRASAWAASGWRRSSPFRGPRHAARPCAHRPGARLVARNAPPHRTGQLTVSSRRTLAGRPAPYTVAGITASCSMRIAMTWGRAASKSSR